MDRSIFKTEVLPSALWFVWLVLLTIVLDMVLHLTALQIVGRYLGIIGLLLILLSFLYSLRKKKIITTGALKSYLAPHEYLAWSGSLAILVHSGIHFNAILPWLATLSMLVVVASGLVGKYLLKRSRESLEIKKENLITSGLPEEEVERQLYWDALTIGAMKEWRKVHKPITMIFAVLTGMHIITILLFWRWR